MQVPEEAQVPQHVEEQVDMEDMEEHILWGLNLRFFLTNLQRWRK